MKLNENNDFMLEAIKEADIAINNKTGGPFGSVIVKDGKIVGRGHNQVVQNKDATCHGEIMAIKDASKNLNTFDLKGCSIYTTAYPCPMCLGAILWANIDYIYYGCDVNDSQKIGFRDKVFYEKMQDKSRFIEVGKKDCQELFKRYENSKGKTNY